MATLGPREGAPGRGRLDTGSGRCRGVLHFANGEATLAGLRAAQIPGDLRSGDDILMAGPIRRGLADAADWSFRAAWLERRLAIPKAEYLVGHARTERALRAAQGADEVVVWSEEDLHCAVNLWRLLARLDALAAPLSLVLPPGVRLGPADPDTLHRLFTQRAPTARETLALATRAWDAFCASDPRALERLLPDARAWPALESALRLHLARFPSARDGLGAMERILLASLREAPATFRDLFGALQKRADFYAYGAGDVLVHGLVADLARGDHALVVADDPRAVDDPLSGGVWRLTDDGRSVLDGQADAVALRGCDTWLGGVELKGADVWRWDGARLLPPA